MNKNTQNTNEQGSKIKNSLHNLRHNSIITGIIIGIFLLLIEYKSGLFQAPQGSSNHSISLLWSGIATFITVAFIISVINFIRISLDSQDYFREQFSLAVFYTIVFLIAGLIVSVAGKLMFWYSLLAALYIVSNQKIIVSQPSWEGYAFLTTLIGILYLFAFIRHQNWDGLRSVQQYEREQRSEASEVFFEGFGEFKRTFYGKSTLEKYSELDPLQLLGHLEQSEDFISQAWKEQARELLRLSSSSYDIDTDSGWHDRQGYWVGQNIDTKNLIFLYPAQAALSKTDLDNFVRYSKQIANSKNCQVGELIVAFREDKDKLATPIDSHRKIRFETEDNLLGQLVNFTDYRNDIQKRVLSHKLSESGFTLHDVYVPSQLYVSKGKRANDNVEDYLQKWLDESSQRHIALLGEYGQGKSSAALMFTYRLLCESNQPPKRIPILIELRGKSPRDMRPLELLGAWASQYRIEPQALMRLHIAGRLVLIFEGFDEMALIGNSELRLRHFRSLWKFTYPNAKIIITGRPNFFLDDREMKTALGIIKPISEEPYCESIRLAPFTINQIQEALREQNPVVRDQICSLAQNEPRFLEIVSRPSLLHVVSLLWEKEKLHEKTALLNSAYVMECFVRSSYRRQGLKALGSRNFMALNSSERDYFMCGIASYMVAKELSNQISNEQLNYLIGNLTEAIPESISTYSSEILGEDIRPLRSRIQDPKEDMEHIITDVRTCGLLVDDPSAPGILKFGHKSFMEYLFATTVKEYIWDSSLEKARAIRKVTSFPIEAILDLPVSVDFLAEMIGTDPATKQLNSTNNVSSKGEGTTSIRLLKVIFYTKNNSYYWLMLRFGLLSLSYNASRRSLQPIQRTFLLFTNPLIVLCYSLIFLVYQVSANQKGINFTVASSNDFTALFATFSALMLSILNFLTLFITKAIVPKFRLWNSICQKLGINDEVLHQIAGTWLFPWARNQPFNYFLIQSKVHHGSGN
ncbi:hypothetical protein NDA03_21730 [Trichocoleus sp. Lan]|uniref:NACHT domain-containing protein n=1 Tax=Trichocoleus sp. Lan TaxID=2933927 RepID=UPI00329705B2